MTPPMGAGALIRFPPRDGELKYTFSAVASICALSIAFIDEPLAFAALITFATYVAIFAHVVPVRSWNGL